MTFMKLLENLYEKPPKLSQFFGRRYHINSPKTLLLGMNKCGISSIIIDFLSTLEQNSYLYIDLADLRVGKTSLKHLDIFVKKHKINSLILENYTKDIVLPSIENIILSSTNSSLHVKDFAPLHVSPLNFEEFIGFQQRHFNTEYLFNLFTNSGRLPKNQILNEHENILYIQNALQIVLKEELEKSLFYYFALNQSKPISFHKAYVALKKEIKVSKDKLYRVAYEFTQRGLLSYVPKLNFPKSAKKVYLSDFAFKAALSYEKDFVSLFENMVFCELHVMEKNIYYTDEIHFILPLKKLAVFCIPFLPPELIYRRFTKLFPLLKSLHVKHVWVVTIGNEGSYKKEDIVCEIVPFWEWALML